MRIISGNARGTKLYTLEGENTRPTLDRVKESLFNIIQNKVEDSIVLDLFSGSGAIGLEALSRGAKKAILCDNSKQACEIIKKNINKTHLEGKTTIYNMDFRELLKTKIKERCDIIYLDPPYRTNYAIEAIQIILELKLIKENAIIVIETDEKEKIIGQLEKVDCKIIDSRKYGRAYLIFIQECR